MAREKARPADRPGRPPRNVMPEANSSGPAHPATPRRGRPTMLTEECRMRVLTAKRFGLTNEAAALFAGVHPSTLQRWLSSDREPGLTLQCDVAQQKAAIEVFVVGNLIDHTVTSTRAAEFFLRRRGSERWRLRCRDCKKLIRDRVRARVPKEPRKPVSMVVIPANFAILPGTSGTARTGRNWRRRRRRQGS
jgi:hypothetical protein